jgi:hypothetical protein
LPQLDDDERRFGLTLDGRKDGGQLEFELLAEAETSLGLGGWPPIGGPSIAVASRLCHPQSTSQHPHPICRHKKQNAVTRPGRQISFLQFIRAAGHRQSQILRARALGKQTIHEHQQSFSPLSSFHKPIRQVSLRLPHEISNLGTEATPMDQSLVSRLKLRFPLCQSETSCS